MRPLILAMTLLPLALATQSGLVPATESDPVLDAVRRYVAHWRSTLPDFICQQSTLLFSGSHSDHIWHPTNNQQLELTVVNGREQYQLHQTDNRGPIPVGFPTINSRGEYASALMVLFDPASGTQFHRRGVYNEQNRSLRRYDFAVQQKNSQWYFGPGLGFAPAYEGHIWIDEGDGSVHRLEMEAFRFPDKLFVNKASLRLEFALVVIAELPRLMPSRAVLRVCNQGGRCEQNILEFSNYHKFVATSRLIK